jgi:hypothetical protein
MGTRIHFSTVGFDTHQLLCSLTFNGLVPCNLSDSCCCTAIGQAAWRYAYPILARGLVVVVVDLEQLMIYLHLYLIPLTTRQNFAIMFSNHHHQQSSPKMSMLRTMYVAWNPLDLLEGKVGWHAENQRTHESSVLLKNVNLRLSRMKRLQSLLGVKIPLKKLGSQWRIL